MSHITNNHLIVNLTLHRWTGHRKDKAAAARIEADKQAASGSFIASKVLVDPAKLKPITTAMETANRYVKSMTLPWKDNGDRLLPRTLYLKLMEGFRDCDEKVREAIDHFVDVDYAAAREQAAFRMGAAFDPNDYPRPDELRRKFGMSLDIDAVTDAEDFRRVAIDEDISDTLRAQHEAATAARLQRANEHLWGTLHRLVLTFQTQTSAADKRIYDSLVGNIRDVCETLGDFNVTGDKGLDEMRQELLTTLGAYDVKDLRTSPSVRKAANKDADAVMKKMSGFMAAMSSAYDQDDLAA